MLEAAALISQPTVSASRSGSEKRERSTALAVRLTAAERATLVERAQTAGLSLGGYLRTCALGQAGPRARRSVQVNEVLLAQAVAQLNKAGSNINQIARALNAAGATSTRDHAAALADVRRAVGEILAAVGRDVRS